MYCNNHGTKRCGSRLRRLQCVWSSSHVARFTQRRRRRVSFNASNLCSSKGTDDVGIASWKSEEPSVFHLSSNCRTSRPRLAPDCVQRRVNRTVWNSAFPIFLRFLRLVGLYFILFFSERSVPSLVCLVSENFRRASPIDIS